uniref:SOAR domain-containing protein n=1 Tax=Steinernema glaseri TaxID=37863 RepID=A0A1I8ASZ2_9BILA
MVLPYQIKHVSQRQMGQPASSNFIFSPIESKNVNLKLEISQEQSAEINQQSPLFRVLILLYSRPGLCGDSNIRYPHKHTCGPGLCETRDSASRDRDPGRDVPHSPDVDPNITQTSWKIVSNECLMSLFERFVHESLPNDSVKMISITVFTLFTTVAVLTSVTLCAEKQANKLNPQMPANKPNPAGESHVNITSRADQMLTCKTDPDLRERSNYNVTSTVLDKIDDFSPIKEDRSLRLLSQRRLKKNDVSQWSHNDCGIILAASVRLGTDGSHLLLGEDSMLSRRLSLKEWFSASWRPNPESYILSDDRVDTVFFHANFLFIFLPLLHVMFTILQMMRKDSSVLLEVPFPALKKKPPTPVRASTNETLSIPKNAAVAPRKESVAAPATCGNNSEEMKELLKAVQAMRYMMETMQKDIEMLKTHEKIQQQEMESIKQTLRSREESHRIEIEALKTRERQKDDRISELEKFVTHWREAVAMDLVSEPDEEEKDCKRAADPVVSAHPYPVTPKTLENWREDQRHLFMNVLFRDSERKKEVKNLLGAKGGDETVRDIENLHIGRQPPLRKAPSPKITPKANNPRDDQCDGKPIEASFSMETRGILENVGLNTSRRLPNLLDRSRNSVTPSPRERQQTRIRAGMRRNPVSDDFSDLDEEPYYSSDDHRAQSRFENVRSPIGDNRIRRRY